MKRYLKPLALVEFTDSGLADQAGMASQMAAQWVQLTVLPDPFSDNEALLLTKLSEDEWIAWVPNYGEVTLHTSEFYFPHEWN